jgi:3-methyl-2-oxobutanoate hydroxymethyltransferase
MIPSPGTTTDALAPERVTMQRLTAMKAAGERIAMVTAYDAPSARIADDAGVELVLVGDSAATTVLGYQSTIQVTAGEMLVLTRAVARGARRAMVVADLPFGSFQVSDSVALAHAVRFIKHGGASAVKVEGAGSTIARVRALVDVGVPVMGHIGLTPQSATLRGALKARGLTARAARRLCREAIALQKAGCFALVIEAVPEPVAARITTLLRIPTIGIGAGAACDGQVLVWHDLVGLTPGPMPRFVKQYANVGEMIRTALETYVTDVRARRFPEPRHTYRMPVQELRLFEARCASRPSGRERVPASVGEPA